MHTEPLHGALQFMYTFYHSLIALTVQVTVYSVYEQQIYTIIIGKKGWHLHYILV